MSHCCWKMAVDPKSRWKHQRLYRLGLKYKSLKHKKDYFRLGLVECQNRFNLNIGRCFEKPFGLFLEPLEVFFERIKARRRAENNIPGTIYYPENNILHRKQYTRIYNIDSICTIQTTIYRGAAGDRRQLASTILVNIENYSQWCASFVSWIFSFV